MNPPMRSPQEQLAGLVRLAELIAKSECNTVIAHPPGDVAYLTAVDTPRASQVVYAVAGYDVWVWAPHEFGTHQPQSSDLSLEDAAKVVVAEYHLAKAGRIVAAGKHRGLDLDPDEVMATLTKGYQKVKTTSG